MRVSQHLAAIAIGGLLWVMSSTNAASAPVPILPEAEPWVVTSDIPRFSVTWARGGEGGGGVAHSYFGDHPENGGGLARYEDKNRHMFIEVRVWRDVRDTYLDYFLENPKRDSQTGEFSKNVSLVDVLGNPVFLYCSKSPECKKRIYSWRSGSAVIVRVAAYALIREGVPYGPQVDLPVPEPTEILAAYLERYPSSLTDNWEVPEWSWVSSEQRARDHLRIGVALELAAVKYWLAMVERSGAEQARQGWFNHIEHHLIWFARRRAEVLGGPDWSAEESRVRRTRTLPPAERLQQLQLIAQDFQQWWTDNVGTPIQVPDLPPEPTPAPGTPPVTTPSPAPPTTPSPPVTP